MWTPDKNSKCGTVTMRVSRENPKRSIAWICIYFCALDFSGELETAFSDGRTVTALKIGMFFAQRDIFPHILAYAISN